MKRKIGLLMMVGLHKKICNKWDKFPPLTYKTFFNLLSTDFTQRLSDLTNKKPLYPDIGLHGGGWHMHVKGGNCSSTP